MRSLSPHATRTGIGVAWYTRLEQGRDIIASQQILESLARVFNLNAAERHHLFVLAREQVPADTYPLTSSISPQLQSTLDTMRNNPAYVINPRWDMVGWNQAMHDIFADFNTISMQPRNIPLSLFGDPEQRHMYVDWEKEARGKLALLRATSDRYVKEVWFKALVAELQQISPEFRAWWPQHNIQATFIEQKELNHPIVRRLALQSSMFQVIDTPDLMMIIFTAADAEMDQKLKQLTMSSEVQLTS